MHTTISFPTSPLPLPTAPRQVPPRNVTKIRTNCTNCSLRNLCLPCGLKGRDMARAEEVVYTRKRVNRGESLYRTGDPFLSLYAIRNGFFKSTLTLADGRDQVTAFHMRGEMLGMDGIGAGTHESTAIALEDSEVCVMPYGLLQQLSRDIPELQNQFHKVMSRELVREHGVMMLLGSMRTNERVAAFLLNLAKRLGACGYSSKQFQLCMTRREIGSYLGLQLETVSRAFSQFQEDGFLSVQQRQIGILDVDGLRTALGKR